MNMSQAKQLRDVLTQLLFVLKEKWGNTVNLKINEYEKYIEVKLIFWKK